MCALLNPGNFGTIDTIRRLQVERWIRAGEPAVRPDDTSLGLVGRNGVLYPPYGIGQSLVLLPFDAFVSGTVGHALRRFGLDAARREQIVELSVAFLMQSFLTACLLMAAHAVLMSFGFDFLVSAVGALALLFSTTCFQYVQCAQETLLLLVLALTALWAIRRYQLSGAGKFAALAGMAMGFAILVRLTSVLEAGVFGLLALVMAKDRKKLFIGYGTPLAVAFLIDRWYQYYRFGELLSTYTGILERHSRMPNAPAQYMFSYPFWKGFLGAFYSPDKSILLFDPLLVVLLILVAFGWRELDRALGTALAWLGVLLIAYLVFYAKYYFFGGGVSWGDRYVLMPVQVLCLFAVPILLTEARTLPRWVRRTLWAVVLASVLMQAGSTAIAPNLEVLQRDAGYRHGALWNRAVNILEISRDREEPARFQGVPVEWRTLYYFAFQLRFRFPVLARWAIGGWLILLVCLPVAVLGALRAARAGVKPG